MEGKREARIEGDQPKHCWFQTDQKTRKGSRCPRYASQPSFETNNIREKTEKKEREEEEEPTTTTTQQMSYDNKTNIFSCEIFFGRF